MLPDTFGGVRFSYLGMIRRYEPGGILICFLWHYWGELDANGHWTLAEAKWCTVIMICDECGSVVFATRQSGGPGGCLNSQLTYMNIERFFLTSLLSPCFLICLLLTCYSSRLISSFFPSFYLLYTFIVIAGIGPFSSLLSLICRNRGERGFTCWTGSHACFGQYLTVILP